MPEPPLFPVLETERLRLREFRPDDREALFAIFSKEEVARYYGMTPFKNVKRSDSVLKRRMKLLHIDNGVAWGVTLKGSDQLIGGCRFKSWEKKSKVSEIAYEMHPDYWNRGLMTEAVRAAIAYGFDVANLNRIEAWVATENVASIKVLEKVGFQYEGTQRERYFWNDRYHDMDFYSLLRREWNHFASSLSSGGSAGKS